MQRAEAVGVLPLSFLPAAVASPAVTASPAAPSLSVPDVPDVSAVTQQAAEQLQDINASVSQAAAGTGRACT